VDQAGEALMQMGQKEQVAATAAAAVHALVDMTVAPMHARPLVRDAHCTRHSAECAPALNLRSSGGGTSNKHNCATEPAGKTSCAQPRKRERRTLIQINPSCSEQRWVAADRATGSQGPSQKGPFCSYCTTKINRGLIHQAASVPGAILHSCMGTH
jgi:hypothetical protein